MSMPKQKLLWIGHVLAETGYSRVTENILSYLCRDYDVSVLGLTYDGDPHSKPYRIYRADRYGDPWGFNRLHEIITREQPDIVCAVMEPWNLTTLIQDIRGRMRNAVKVAGYCVVDGENMKPVHGEWLSQFDVTIFPTQFALDQAKEAGFNGYWYIVPHGVDPTMYKPCNQRRARSMIGLGNILNPDAFVFGNVNENQPRKRLDLTIEGWARWFNLAGRPENAYLYIHANKRSPVGWDLGQLAKHHGIRGRIVAPAEDVRYGEASMKYVYNALDVQFSTTMGEGWGFTSMESMACGVPQILPRSAALGEWARTGAWMIGKGRPVYGSAQQNVKQYEPDMDELVEALHYAWSNPGERRTMGQRGRELVLRDEFRWSMVAGGFNAAFQDAMQGPGVSKEFLVEAASGPSGTGTR